MLDYCRHNKIFVLDVQESISLFQNKAIDSNCFFCQFFKCKISMTLTLSRTAFYWRNQPSAREFAWIQPNRMVWQGQKAMSCLLEESSRMGELNLPLCFRQGNAQYSLHLLRIDCWWWCSKWRYFILRSDIDLSLSIIYLFITFFYFRICWYGSILAS